MEYRGGYVGLVAILLGTALLVFFAVRLYYSPASAPRANDAEAQDAVEVPPPGPVTLPAARAKVDAATQAQQRLNQYNQDISNELGN